MTGDEVRSSFLQFFQDRGHLAMPSASLIPAGDPTLLFTSAGMVPFKPFFMGEQTPPSLRLTSSQKSFRTTDIDEVGDHKHLTFFEMLGNFSIGDYFKDYAIALAWELVTQVFHLPADRLYVTVHLDDEDAFLIWRDEIGVPVERIYRYGDKDNWWGPAGTEGPTGPCSEIHYDGGADKGCGPMVEPDVLTALQRQERDTGEDQTVPGCHPTATASVSWSCGTWCSCSSTRTRSGTGRPCRPPAWIPAWAWSGPPSFSKAKTTSTKPTCSRPSLSGCVS